MMKYSEEEYKWALSIYDKMKKENVPDCDQPNFWPWTTFSRKDLDRANKIVLNRIEERLNEK